MTETVKVARATIQSKRLILVPFEDRHVCPRHLSWVNDKSLMKFSEQRHHTHTLQSCAAYANSFESTPNYYWAIEKKDKKLGHIGTINAYINVANKTADIGLLIGDADAHGQGYGLEAWLAVIDFLFNTCSIRKVTAGTMATNAAMLHIMERSGMLADGVRKRHFLDTNNAEVDCVYTAAFKDSWLGGKIKV